MKRKTAGGLRPIWALVAFGILAVIAVVISSERAPRTASTAQPTQAGVETVYGYLVRTCPNGQGINSAMQVTEAARRVHAKNETEFAAKVAQQFLLCTHATSDTFARDWAMFDYGYWIDRSASTGVAGVPVVEKSIAVLTRLQNNTAYDTVRTGTSDLLRSVKADLAKRESSGNSNNAGQ